MSARESIIPVFVPHLGCPNDCVFCNQRRISGSLQPATAADVEKAINDAAALLPKGAKRQLAFYGGSFTAIPHEQQLSLLKAAKAGLDAGLIHSVRLSTRPDAIDGEILNTLSRYGVETVELGAQSMDDEVLALSGRGHTAGDVEQASGLIKSRGFRLILQMMTGLPGDSPEKSIATAERIIALRPDGVRIYPTVVVRDTALFDLWQAGHYTPHSVEDAVELCSRIVSMFEKAGIPIIRLGLNPTEELSGGMAAAGAYHPALGEMVKSRIMLKKAVVLLEGTAAGSCVVLGVHKSMISQMTGQKRCNATALTERFSLSGLKIVAADVPEGQISLISVEKP